MKTKRNNKGFTMAEMLIVVAILIVLLAVAFIAVPRYQRSMTRLEFDTIAKEIFIAAQNHLTTAESQGYLQRDDSKLGTAGDSAEDTLGERYFVYPTDTYHSTAADQTVLDLMLPFGSIDETIRTGGSYIIRYQPSSGRVLDVFFSMPGKSSMLTVTGRELAAADYTTLMSDTYRKDDNNGKRNRQNFDDGGAVVGWYGDGDSLPTGTRLKDPEVVVHNEEKLWVEVKDNNPTVTDSSLKLVVTGTVSGAQKSFTLNSTVSDSRITTTIDGDGKPVYRIILDDITDANLHFDNLSHDSAEDFIPGENLAIEAVAFNNAALSNVAYSGKKITNSLFAELTEKSSVTSGGTTTTDYIAGIANFRHFENLDKTISNFSPATCYKDANGDVKPVNKAEQLKDLRWKKGSGTENGFLENIGGTTVQIYTAATTASTATTENCLYPVNLDYSLDYDGTNHKIYNVDVSHTVDAGLFGMIGNVTSSTITNEVKNLELIDFNVIISTGSGNAGALAGTAYKATVTNVVAYNTAATGTPDVTASASAGGLIGSVDNCSVSKCAAALTVNGGKYAGGLVGESNAGTVTASYSGGHTDKAEYYNHDNNDKRTTEIYNVTATDTATGTAGGLIGAAGTTSIYYSYSTCSVKGARAGGFVGTSSSGNIEDCYCTGLVSGTNSEGAFASSASGTVSGCQYFEIINERRNEDSSGNQISGYHYLTALGGGASNTGITKIDDSATSYQTFSGAPTTSWQTAYPYDSTLTDYYGTGSGASRVSRYNLKTVQQLGATIVTATDFVTVHHGDWPAPETFVYN